MLVYDQFAGDDMTLATRQHDIYAQGVDLLVEGARRHFVTACQIAGGDPERWPGDAPIDHRAFQDAHDIAAAAWRWLVSPPQFSLALAQARSLDQGMDAWLGWLAADVARWWDQPDLIVSAAAIVRFPGAAIGVEGEQRLRRGLRARYAEVPWWGELAAD